MPAFNETILRSALITADLVRVTSSAKQNAVETSSRITMRFIRQEFRLHPNLARRPWRQMALFSLTNCQNDQIDDRISSATG
jgi:hypothetical protein